MSKKSHAYLICPSWSKTFFALVCELIPTTKSPHVCVSLSSGWRVYTDEPLRDPGSVWQGQRSRGSDDDAAEIERKCFLSHSASLFIRVYFATLFSWTSPAAVSLSGALFLFPSAGFPCFTPSCSSVCGSLSPCLFSLCLSPVVWQFSALHSSCVCLCVCVYIRRELLASVFPGVCVCVWFWILYKKPFEVFCPCVR